jgi:hypothetical protein
MFVYGQLQVCQAENLTADPPLTPLGRFYYNSTTNELRIWTGSLWSAIAAQNSDLPNIQGTKASPLAITAVGGITSNGAYNAFQFIQGSGGPVTVSATPQITAGVNVGQKLTLFSRSNTNTVTLQDGTGLSLNGTWVGSQDRNLVLIWDGVTWTEISRR